MMIGRQIPKSESAYRVFPDIFSSCSLWWGVGHKRFLIEKPFRQPICLREVEGPRGELIRVAQSR